MFKNIGVKIKGFAQIVCWLGIIGSIIPGLVLIGIGSEIEYGGGIVFLGILIAIDGSIASWIGSFLTYGFGELIDKTCEIKQLISGTNSTYKFNIDNQPTEIPNNEQEAFIRQILSTPTSDLLLILEDQQDLYNEAEIRIIKDVLSKRAGRES